jgi:uncharacterized protein (UPF0332 family)
MNSGKLYSRLFNLRQEGDYMDFKRFDSDDIQPFINDVNKFLAEIADAIKK